MPPLSADAVVADAVRLADQDGFAAVSLSAVARRLGVQTPSLYTHVRDLNTLRDGVTAHALADLAAQVASAIAGRSGLPALRAFAEAHRTFARDYPGRWDALQRRAGETAVRSPAARQIVELTAAVLRGYPVPESEHTYAVRVLGSTINGYLHLESIGGFDHSSPDTDTSWRRTVDALDALLNAWPSGEK